MTSSMNQDVITNVASIPQRSPFRYPGGKTWLVPKFRQWIRSLPFKPELFIEPFLGGGILSLTAAFEGLAEHVLMTDIDDDLSSVWETILSENGRDLANLILNFKLSLDSYHEVVNALPKSRLEQAFQTILRNRVAHGGILAPGGGIIKKGEGGKGISSRWYPETISRRILEISALKGKITYVQEDAFQVLNKYCNQKKIAWLFDPPYTFGKKKAGRRLYTHNIIDHDKLFDFSSKLSGDFLMTYENDNHVIDLALTKKFKVLPISMKSRHHAEMTELLISRNLDCFVS